MNNRAPKSFTVALRNSTMMIHEWEGEGNPVLLVHATGFHGRCWDQVVAKLPESQHVIAIDLPCHGGSEKTAPPYTWPSFADDVIDFIEKKNLNNVLAVGHSFGGHIVIRAAAAIPERLTAVLALDPVIFSPKLLPVIRMFTKNHPASKRRNSWASADELYETYKTRSPFDLWDPQVLRDYCDYGLMKSADNTHYTLACPPNIEATLYNCAGGKDIYKLLPTITVPVHIIRARARQKTDTAMDFRPSPTWSKLGKAIPLSTDRRIKLTHFFPMEKPSFVANEIGQILDLSRRLQDS